MSQFPRFPQTTLMDWLGEGEPRDDKGLSVVEARTVWSAEVVPEEKIDGANIGASLRADNGLTVWKGWRPCFHHLGHVGGPCHTTKRMQVRKLRKSREANEHLTGHPGLYGGSQFQPRESRLC
jgi:hypothetical protein